jgi:hypothetical protein
MVLDANGHLLETTRALETVKCNLSIPSKGSVEPAYGPGNATKLALRRCRSQRVTGQSSVTGGTAMSAGSSNDAIKLATKNF